MAKGLRYFKSYEIILKELGADAAAVYSIIESYSKLKKGYCTLTQVNIGEAINASYKVVSGVLKTLQDEGLIVEVEPDKRNKLDNTKYYKPRPMGLALFMDKPKRGMLPVNEGRKFQSEKQRKILKEYYAAKDEAEKLEMERYVAGLVSDLNQGKDIVERGE